MGFDQYEINIVKNLGIKRIQGNHYILGYLKGKKIEYDPTY